MVLKERVRWNFPLPVLCPPTPTPHLLPHLFHSSTPDNVSALCWDPSSLYLVSAGGEDRYIRVWHNHPGRRELIRDLKTELPKAASEALKVGGGEKRQEEKGG